MKMLKRLHMLSRAENLQPLRQFVKDLAIDQGCAEKNIECFVMAINEACMNVIQHAYQGTDEEDIVVEFWKQDEDLLIRIIDHADPANLSDIQSRDLEDVRPGGLGVHLINKVMDHVEYRHLDQSRGNVLEMRKSIKRSSPVES